jgi:dCMP deaminase
MLQDGWDLRFLSLAKHVSQWSKDPSTKVGSVIVDPSRRVLSMGYNGFPAQIKDDQEDYLNRDLKLKKVVHAEANSIIFAQRDLSTSTLYVWPFMPCSNCAGLVIQSGIKKVVSVENDNPKWQGSFRLTEEMFESAGVILRLYDQDQVK